MAQITQPITLKTAMVRMGFSTAPIRAREANAPIAPMMKVRG